MLAKDVADPKRGRRTSCAATLVVNTKGSGGRDGVNILKPRCSQRGENAVSALTNNSDSLFHGMLWLQYDLLVRMSTEWSDK